MAAASASGETIRPSRKNLSLAASTRSSVILSRIDTATMSGETPRVANGQRLLDRTHCCFIQSCILRNSFLQDQATDTVRPSAHRENAGCAMQAGPKGPGIPVRPGNRETDPQNSPETGSWHALRASNLHCARILASSLRDSANRLSILWFKQKGAKESSVELLFRVYLMDVADKLDGQNVSV